jgi:Septum formation
LLLVVTGCDSKQLQAIASASAAASVPPPYTPVAGTCFNYETQRGAQDTVPCDGEHRFEVAYVGQVTDKLDTPPLPSSETSKTAYQQCLTKIDRYVGGAYPALLVNIELGYPGLAAWRAGNHWFSCDLAKASFEREADESGEVSVTGSVKNAYADPKSSVRVPCSTATETKDGSITDWKPVACTAKHTVELAGLVRSTSKAASRPKNDDKLVDTCLDLVAAYIKVPRDDDEKYGIHVIWSYPPSPEWAAGERRVRCYVHLMKGSVSRSLAGAGPSAL